MFFRHSIIYLFARGLPSLIAFLSVAIYTRLLNPSEFGIYALAYTAATLISAIMFQWLRIGLLRYYQERSNDQKIVLISTIAVGFIVTTSGLCLLIIPVIAFYKHVVLLLVVLLLGILQSAFDILLERSRVELSPVRFGAVALTRALLMLIGGVSGYEIAGVIGMLVGLLLGILPIVIVELRSAISFIKFTQASQIETRRLLRFGVPLTATFALAGVMGFADRYMLAWLSNTAAAGQYTASYDITQKIIVTLMMVVNLAGYPLLLNAQGDGDTEKFNIRLKQTLNGLLLIGLPIMSAFVLFPSTLVDVLLGKAFRLQAIMLLPWLSVAALVEGMKVYYFDLSFQLRQNTFHQAWIVGLAAALNVGMNLWLIPMYGGLGAAWATLLANSLALGLSFAISRTQLRMPLFTRDTVLIIVSSSLMCVIMWMILPIITKELSHSVVRLLSLAIVGGLIYVTSNLVLNTMGSRKKLIALWCVVWPRLRWNGM